MSNPPKVSVVTSVYNGEKYIEDCVQSILSQSFRDFEYIVLNNGSTDGTAELLDKFDDPRLKIVHQENLGISRSLNKGIDMACSELIARLDADDVSSPDRLEIQVRFMESNPEFVLCAGGYNKWKDGEISPQTVPLPCSDAEIRSCLSDYNPIAHSAAMFRKEAFNKVGGYDRRLDFSQDYDLWIKLMKTGKACNLQDVLGFVRFYEVSTLSKNKNNTFFEAVKVKRRAYCFHGGSFFNLLFFVVRGFSVLICRNVFQLK